MFIKNNDGSLKHSRFLPITPDVPALARTISYPISSSTEIVLHKATSFLRVYAISQDVFLKWGTADVTAANFDEVIPAGQIVDLLVPNGMTAINLIERIPTAAVITIEK
jgi:hypothetical protein